MKIVVAGASGLIGRFVHARLSRDHETIALGRSVASDVRLDLGDPAAIANADLRNTDAFVHCAGVIDEEVRLDRAAAYARSTAAAAALADVLRRDRVGSIVYVSSAHVYGPLTGTLDEGSPPNPLSDYAIAHFATEQIFRRIASPAQRVVILRPCAVFGMPDMARFSRWSLIPFSFPMEAVEQGKIVLRSSGDQRRNLIGTEDLAEEIAIQLVQPSEILPFRITNPIGADTMTVLEFAFLCADVCRELTGRPCEVTRTAAPAGGEAPLEYLSLNAYHRSRQKVAPFVRDFTKMLLARKESNDLHSLT